MAPPSTTAPADTPGEQPPPEAPGVLPSAIADGEWVTSAPPRWREVVTRIVTFPRLLMRHRDLVRTSVGRELQTRFQGTVLGWLWPLVHPLFIFAVYYFLFTKLLSFKLPDLQPGQEAAMGVYMFVGVVVWAAFGESLGVGCNVIVSNGNLIKKLAFPSEILPLNVVLANAVTMVFGLSMFVLATSVTDVWAAPSWNLMWAPVLLFLQVLFTYGVVLFVSTMQVFLRDTAQVVSIVATVWMFLTPLFWVPEAIPEIGPYIPLIEANPFHHLVYAWREILMGITELATSLEGYTNGFVIPEKNLEPGVDIQPLDAMHDYIASIKIFAVWAVGVFAAGYAFFIMSQRRFADEV